MKILPIFLFAFFLCLTSSLSAATISSTPQGGIWGEKSTWVNAVVPTENDDVVITSVVTFGNVSYTTRTYKMNNLTIMPGGRIEREKEGAGKFNLEIHGTLLNNGDLIDYTDYFDLNLYGNLENNGIFKPRYLYFLNEKQTISGTKPNSASQIKLQMKDDYITASSDLSFLNCDISGNTNKGLDMKNFKLSLSADSITSDTYYGKIYSKGVISVPIKFNSTNTGCIMLDKAILSNNITGNILLTSPTYAFLKDLTVDGNLTIDRATKVSGNGNNVKLYVKGNFTNDGELNKDSIRCGKVEFPTRTMMLYIYGNIASYGSTGITSVYPITNGNTITLEGYFEGDMQLRQAENNTLPGGKVLIKKEATVRGDFDVYTEVEIAKGGILNLPNQIISNPIYIYADQGKVYNYGTINRYHNISDTYSKRLFKDKPGSHIDFELRDWTSRIECISVSEINGTTYPGLPGSTKRWWHIEPVGDGEVKTYTAKFYYDEAMLNGQSEENLKVYQSSDNGETWNVVSHGEYAILNTEENSISIGNTSHNESMLSEFGDFVISSGDGSVPIQSPVKIDLVGRNDIRVGAPNPFDVHIYNVTDQFVGSFVIGVAASNNIAFRKLEIPTNNGKIIHEQEALFPGENNMLFLYVPNLEPNEHSSFTVIVYGMNTNLKSTTISEPYIATLNFLDDVLSKKITSPQWINEKSKALAEHVYDIKNLFEEEKTAINKAKEELPRIIEEKKQRVKQVVYCDKDLVDAFSKHVDDVLSGHLDIVDAIADIGIALERMDRVSQPYRDRLWAWLNNESITSASNLAGKYIEGKLVTSWDPNEMIGPAGYGELHFMSSIPRMNYTILFENKKEATAPAYRIQIIDTLSSAFNPETVTFDGTSHSAANYNWKMERNGNIIKWDIEGIELVPNATPPEGEGFVRFSVALNDAVKHGDVIANRATIIFDMNAPIQTNTWINTLDFEAPKTKMNSIDYSAGDTLITLSCNSDDGNGAGAAYYGWYASYNDGPFLFVGETFSNEIEYAIHSDSMNNYRFFALATDYVDNAENTVPEYIHLKTEPLSIDLVSMPHNFTVYPNPSSGIINVQTKGYLKGAYNCTLISIIGEKCLSFTINDKQNMTIDISKLHSGVYLLKIEKDNLETEMHRIVKQ